MTALGSEQLTTGDQRSSLAEKLKEASLGNGLFSDRLLMNLAADEIHLLRQDLDMWQDRWAAEHEAHNTTLEAPCPHCGCKP